MSYNFYVYNKLYMETIIENNKMNYYIADTELIIYDKNNSNKKFKFDCTSISNMEVSLEIPSSSGMLLTTSNSPSNNNIIININNNLKWDFLPSFQQLVTNPTAIALNLSTTIPLYLTSTIYDVNTFNTGGWVYNMFTVPVNGIYTFVYCGTINNIDSTNNGSISIYGTNTSSTNAQNNRATKIVYANKSAIYFLVVTGQYIKDDKVQIFIGNIANKLQIYPPSFSCTLIRST
jgi:hypothetical protein